jgi:hypothetical protein
MRIRFGAALAIVLAVALLAPAGASAQATLTLTRNCTAYPPFHGVDVSLTGLPPNTPFTGTILFPEGGGAGPADLVTDSDGNFIIGPFGSSVPGTFEVTATWAGGTLTASLDVNCGRPQTKDDCKDGGWRDFGFRNQGQCIKAVKRPGG